MAAIYDMDIGKNAGSANPDLAVEAGSHYDAFIAPGSIRSILIRRRQWAWQRHQCLLRWREC